MNRNSAFYVAGAGSINYFNVLDQSLKLILAAGWRAVDRFDVLRPAKAIDKVGRCILYQPDLVQSIYIPLQMQWITIIMKWTCRSLLPDPWRFIEEQSWKIAFLDTEFLSLLKSCTKPWLFIPLWRMGAFSERDKHFCQFFKTVPTSINSVALSQMLFIQKPIYFRHSDIITMIAAARTRCTRMRYTAECNQHTNGSWTLGILTCLTVASCRYWRELFFSYACIFSYAWQHFAPEH